jgi:hypothetical protein
VKFVLKGPIQIEGIKKRIISVPIFSKRTEILFLALPFLLLPICIWSMISTDSIFDLKGDLFWSFLRNVIFLNTLHIFFSFNLFFRCPEVIEWTKKRKGISFQLEALIVFVLIFSFFMILSYSFRNEISSINFQRLLTAAFSFLFAYHHGLNQVRGLSMLYSFTATNPESSSAFKWERKLFNLLIVVGGLFGTIQLGSLIWVELGLSKLMSSVLLSFTLIFCSLIVLNCFRFPGPVNINKIIYLLRVPAWGLYFISPFWQLITSACHGIEYFCVYSKIKVGSTGRKNWVSKISILLFIFFSWLILTQYNSLPIVSWITPATSPFQSFLILALVKSLVLTHFYLDAQLYKFRNVDSKVLVLPLLSYKTA